MSTLRKPRPRLGSAAILVVGLLAAGCAEPVNLKVQVVDSSSSAVAAARLEILREGLVTDFDASGVVAIPALRIHGMVAFKLSAPGYETMFRVFDLDPGQSYDLTIRMRRAPARQRITLPALGDQVTVKQGISSLVLRGGGLVHADGRDVTGEVDVLMVPYDPVSREEPPASMVTDTGKQLISMGMATITITQNGEALQPRAGMPLEWQMEIAPTLIPFDFVEGYKMYYVDERTGLWHEDPTATFRHPPIAEGEKDHWVAELPHLTVWNADNAFDPTACISGSVHDAHGQLYLGSGEVHGVDVSVGTSIDAAGCGDQGWCGDDCGWCEDGALGTVAYTYTAHLQSGSFNMPVPAINEWGRTQLNLDELYGLVVLPMEITLRGVELPGQRLGRVSIDGAAAPISLVQGPITSQDGGACTNVVFRYCYPEGAACVATDVCCNGQPCSAEGKCGPGDPIVVMCVPLNGSCSTGTCCSGLSCDPVSITCKGCSPKGSVCSTAGDCCSGSCEDQVCN